MESNTHNDSIVIIIITKFNTKRYWEKISYHLLAVSIFITALIQSFHLLGVLQNVILSYNTTFMYKIKI